MSKDGKTGCLWCGAERRDAVVPLAYRWFPAVRVVIPDGDVLLEACLNHDDLLIQFIKELRDMRSPEGRQKRIDDFNKVVQIREEQTGLWSEFRRNSIAIRKTVSGWERG